MYKIKSLNYTVIAKSKLAYNALRLTQYNFIGSTSLFYFILNCLFRNSYYLNIDGAEYLWPIETISDLRLIRGEYEADSNKYSIGIGYEGVDIMFIKSLIKKGDFIIDIGANKGFYTCLLSSLVGPDGKIFSFEASPHNYKIFFDRVSKIWNLKNCISFNFILTDNDNERVSLAKPSIFDDGTGFYFKKRLSSYSASYSRKIDTLLGGLNISRIKLLKIDVEGAEVIVLRGSREVLGKTDFILVEASHTGIDRFGTTVNDLYDLLGYHGFTHFYYIAISGNGASVVTKANHGDVGNILFSKSVIE